MLQTPLMRTEQELAVGDTRWPSTIVPSVELSDALDTDLIMSMLAESRLTVNDSCKAQFFLTCQDLNEGKTTTKEFCDVAKAWCAVAAAATPLVGAPHASFLNPIPSLMGASFGAVSAMEEVAAQIKARVETSKMHDRYLSGLETARDLAPESIRIVTVVKEVVEDGFDDHEVTYLHADSVAIRDFLREEIVPLIEKLENLKPEDAPLDPIRRKRSELKSKLEAHRKSVNVHLQRIQSGLSIMQQGDMYSVRTNHLTRYAAASALEVLLRAYYIVLGRFDPEDFMLDNDWRILQKIAGERTQSIYSLFSEYASKRQTLLTSKFEKGKTRKEHDFSFYVHDAGAAQDHLFAKIKLVDVASHLSASRPALQFGCGTKAHGDGKFEYFNDTLRGRNRATAPGLSLLGETRDLMTTALAHNGPVWKEVVESHIANMSTVLTVVHNHLQVALTPPPLPRRPQAAIQ